MLADPTEKPWAWRACCRSSPRSSAGTQDTDGRAFIAAVCGAVKALHPDNLTQDDATIVLFRANGTRTSIRNDLLAPLRFLGGVSDNSQIATAKTA